MKSMKYSSAELKKRNKLDVPMVGGDQASYPWGLTITLDKEVLGKLGKDVQDFKMGSSLTITAKAEVVSLSEEENRSEVRLQITDLDVGIAGRVEKSAAQQKSGPGGKAVA